ncbi:unnamed protein product [Oppiella nova]|uniref:C2H2-type domain-containing protein n=1 Tax=Oppiella nova TaxID=334625 RepID=A0A7R9L977_9ACAR|nr:unnamed protein product [Oppiella nova]CAG2160487.1 unnamed protein product [Oppiella nova]
MDGELEAFDNNLCERVTQLNANYVSLNSHELNDKSIDFTNCRNLLRINANYNPLSGEPDEHREVQEVDGVVDENIGELESLVVLEETQEVKTLGTEVDDRDRDETEGPEEMSEAEEGGESGVGDQHKDTPEVTEGGDGREGIDNCEPNEGNGALNSGDQPFVCFWPNCGKQFARKYNLKEHKSAVHLKLKRFRCDVEGCGQRFSNKSSLNQHKRLHSGKAIQMQ